MRVIARATVVAVLLSAPGAEAAERRVIAGANLAKLRVALQSPPRNPRVVLDDKELRNDIIDGRVDVLELLVPPLGGGDAPLRTCASESTRFRNRDHVSEVDVSTLLEWLDSPVTKRLDAFERSSPGKKKDRFSALARVVARLPEDQRKTETAWVGGVLAHTDAATAYNAEFVEEFRDRIEDSTLQKLQAQELELRATEVRKIAVDPENKEKVDVERLVDFGTIEVDGKTYAKAWDKADLVVVPVQSDEAPTSEEFKELVQGRKETTSAVVEAQ